ncbi:MAG: tetratricopeptide repeat protein [Chlorobiota bacterium]
MRGVVKIGIVILIVSFSSLLKSQDEMSFNTAYYEAVDKWVAFPNSGNDTSYYYGFIYIDQQAGFTYHMGGSFTIDSENNFIPEKSDSTTFMVKVRIDTEWKPIAVIPDDKLKELGLPVVPEWLEVYKTDSESVSYLTNIGYHYNHVGASKLALVPLKEAYKEEPHHEGLEFELSYAYNAIGKFDEARVILEKAIESNPDNFYFYRELGFSLKYLNKVDEAEKIYRKGIELSDNDFEKGQMAINMVIAYFELKNREKFDEWAKLTREFADENSRYVRIVKEIEKNWKE